VHCPGDFTAYFLDEHTLSTVGEQLGLGTCIHFHAEGVARPELWRQFAQFRDHLGATDAEVRAQTFSRLLSRLAVQSMSPAASRLASAPRTCLSERTLQQCRQNLTDAFLTDRLRTVRLQPIAQDLGVSYHSLIHDFSRRFGIAPYEYVDAVRARYAFATLRRGPTVDCPTLKAAALVCGYSDGAHMSRRFRRHFGVAPSAMARELDPRWLARATRTRERG
jgi:AraC-like DNA-binding protein